MTQHTITYAVVGAGLIAERHVEAIQQAEHAELGGIFDLNPASAAELARKHRIPMVYASYEDLLNDPGIDAVTLATPTGTHMDVALPAAAAGKHILCEKPLDVNLEKADAIIDACDRNRVKLAAVFQSRFSGNVRRIKDALDRGCFGRLVLASAQVKWYRSQAYYDSAGWRGTWALDGGGALMNQGIHIIDLLLYLAGDVDTLSAYSGVLTHENIEVEDTICAALRFRSGALGVIEASTSCAPGFPRKLEISGEKGSVTLEGDTLTRWRFDEAAGDVPAPPECPDGQTLASGASDPGAVGSIGHRRQIEDLSLAILENREPFLTGREGRRAIALITGIYRSAATGAPVRVA